ncbi:transmembrane protease serine 9-like [Acanthaster planci]|uniref:Transmembrane protease serine 9-like n=1 Tax=Acanthaster planci TaxID=133434 RepID=A0A8B7YC62_ACAPL|nr:transmembrane protease serine 9-like [Acanthaster planci]
MKFSIFLACLLAVLTPALGRRIVGGSESVPHSRPYQVALYDDPSGGYQYCGGTLIHQRWVVSAGHCKTSSDVFVGLGYHDKYNHGAAGLQLIRGTWFRHPLFHSGTLDNDIALIQLDSHANVVSPNIAPIRIANKRPVKGKNLLVSGWGTTSMVGPSSDTLREVVVKVQTRTACRDAHKPALITDNMFCAAAKGKDSCQGDDGGPIVSGYGDGTHDPGTTLEGITSWGNGCADSRYPSVYIAVGHYCDWIAHTTGDAVTCQTPALGRLIVGGKESKPNSRPYQVAIYDSKDADHQFCGGTLVHKRWVVSAGHCAGGTVYVGLGYHDKYDHTLSGQQLIKGTWYRHPGYTTYFDNDIALIKLSSDADLSSTKIETISITKSPPSAGKNLLVSGWGDLQSGGYSSRVLREVEVQADSMATCRKAYGSSAITDNMFCASASGKDACQNDSGGPIVSNYGASSHNPGTTLEGIVSWGEGCAKPGYPGVYAIVSNYCDWMAQTTGGAVKC